MLSRCQLSKPKALRLFRNTVKVWWINPRSGEANLTGRFSNEGHLAFTLPDILATTTAFWDACLRNNLPYDCEVSGHAVQHQNEGRLAFSLAALPVVTKETPEMFVRPQIHHRGGTAVAVHAIFFQLEVLTGTGFQKSTTSVMNSHSFWVGLVVFNRSSK
jgi:hypothetical protein